jgi:hypothetical protein
MAYAIDSGLSIGASAPLITVQTEPERTREEVANEYFSLVNQMQAVLQTPPADVTQTQANLLGAAMNALRSLAISGMQLPNEIDPTRGPVTAYVTTDMAKQIDMLSRSLRAVGIVNSLPSVEDVKQWQDLATQGLNDIMTSALRAFDNNNSFQAMIELEYVQAGNDLLETQLTQLNTAINATKDVTSLLGDLQEIHNMIAPANVDTSGILAFTDPNKLVAANQQTIFDLMTDQMKSDFNVNIPSDITEAKYLGDGSVNSVFFGIKYTLLNRTLLPVTDPNYIPVSVLNSKGIYYPQSDVLFGPSVTLEAKQELWDAFAGVAGAASARIAFWGMGSRDDPGVNPPDITALGGNANDFYRRFIAPNIDANDPTALKNFQFYYQGSQAAIDYLNTDGKGGPQDNATIRLLMGGMKAHLASISANDGGPVPNLWKDLELVVKPLNTNATTFDSVAQDIFGQPIDPVVDFKGRTDQDVLNSLLSIRIKLAEQLTKLDQLNPPPAAGRDPNSIGAKISDVLQDIEIYLPSSLNINANGPLMLQGLRRWILDNLDKHSNSGTLADQNAAKTAGDIQRNLQEAITSATNLNDTQKEDLRRYMFIFDEFYKSASALLTRITQILEKMAQNAGR